MANWDTQIYTNTIQNYANTSELIDGQYFPKYALCLPRYSKLDGAFSNAPTSVIDCGYVSKAISDETGTFSDLIPMLDIKYTRVKSSQGFTLTFNEVSNDYATSINAKYYRNEVLIDEIDFTPNNSVYYCDHAVKLYDELVLTFNSTNKPYRYLFLGKFEQEQLANGEGIKIVYKDVAVNAKENLIADSSDIKGDLDIQSLKADDITIPNYAFCLPRYSKLDGTVDNVDKINNKIGYISNSISDENGNFTSNPVITLTFNEGNYSSLGIELIFNTFSDDYCDVINIKWYNADTLLDDKTFNPNSSRYLCNNKVDFYDKVIITFEHTSKAYRNVFLSNINFGTTRIWKDDEVIRASCIQDISPISDTISINTLNFTIRNNVGVMFNLQQKQELSLYFDDNLLGLFYLSSGQRLSIDRYSIQCSDVISILDTQMFNGGMYDNTPCGDVISSIMGDIDYYMDETLGTHTISGYIPYTSKRNALSLICFVVGLVVDTSSDDKVNIYQLAYNAEKEKALDDNNVFLSKTSLNTSSTISGVQCTAYTYLQNNEVQQFYTDTVLNGTVTVLANTPCYNWNVSGASILESGTNYCIIECVGSAVTLTANKYTIITDIMTKDSPLILNKNYADIGSVTLINRNNLEEITNRMYDWYVGNESVTSEILVTNNQIGDSVTLNTFDGIRKGLITSMDYTFTGEMKAKITIERGGANESNI